MVMELCQARSMQHLVPRSAEADQNSVGAHRVASCLIVLQNVVASQKKRHGVTLCTSSPRCNTATQTMSTIAI